MIRVIIENIIEFVPNFNISFLNNKEFSGQLIAAKENQLHFRTFFAVSHPLNCFYIHAYSIKLYW